MVTAPLRGRAFKHIFLIGLVWRMRETGQICAFRSSKAVKRVREVLEAASIFSDFLRFTMRLVRLEVVFVRGTVDSPSFVKGVSWKICVLLQRRRNFEVFLRRMVWGVARGFFSFTI